MGADATFWNSHPDAARQAILEHFGAWDPRFSEPVPFFSSWPKPTFVQTGASLKIGGVTYVMGELANTKEKAVRVIHSDPRLSDRPSHFLSPSDI